MTRQEIRALKRTLRATSRVGATADDRLIARETSLRLLQRSIDLGHGRLALQRLATAVSVGAQIEGEHWSYCAQAGKAIADRRMQELYASAAMAAGRTPAHTDERHQAADRVLKSPAAIAVLP